MFQQRQLSKSGAGKDPSTKDNWSMVQEAIKQESGSQDFMKPELSNSSASFHRFEEDMITSRHRSKTQFEQPLVNKKSPNYSLSSSQYTFKGFNLSNSQSLKNSDVRSRYLSKSNYLGVDSIFNNELSEEMLYDIKPFSHKKVPHNMYDFYLDSDRPEKRSPIRNPCCAPLMFSDRSDFSYQ